MKYIIYFLWFYIACVCADENTFNMEEWIKNNPVDERPIKDFNIVNMILESDVVVVATRVHNSPLDYIIIEEILFPPVNLSDKGHLYFAEINNPASLGISNAPHQPRVYVGHVRTSTIHSIRDRFEADRLHPGMKYLLFLKQDYENSYFDARVVFKSGLILPEHATAYTVVNGAFGVIPYVDFPDKVDGMVDEVLVSSPGIDQSNINNRKNYLAFQMQRKKDLYKKIHGSVNLISVAEAVKIFSRVLAETDPNVVFDLLTDNEFNQNEIFKKFTASFFSQMDLNLYNNIQNKLKLRNEMDIIEILKTPRHNVIMSEVLTNKLDQFEIINKKHPDSYKVGDILHFIEDAFPGEIHFIYNENHHRFSHNVPEPVFQILLDRDTLGNWLWNLGYNYFLKFTETEKGIEINPF